MWISRQKFLMICAIQRKLLRWINNTYALLDTLLNHFYLGIVKQATTECDNYHPIQTNPVQSNSLSNCVLIYTTLNNNCLWNGFFFYRAHSSRIKIMMLFDFKEFVTMGENYKISTIEIVAHENNAHEMRTVVCFIFFFRCMFLIHSADIHMLPNHRIS